MGQLARRRLFVGPESRLAQPASVRTGWVCLHGPVHMEQQDCAQLNDYSSTVHNLIELP